MKSEPSRWQRSELRPPSMDFLWVMCFCSIIKPLSTGNIDHQRVGDMTSQLLISTAMHLPFESAVTVLEVRTAISIIPPECTLGQRSFVFIKRSLKYYLR